MMSDPRAFRPDYDALVVGGGPAGAAAGALLARRGRRVLIVERQRFPRFHIGESLIPETNRWLEAIGAYEKVAAAGFPVKRGAIIMAPDGEHQRYAFFGDSRGVARRETFEVPRDRFDQILLDHAEGCGAEVLQEHRAKAVKLRGAGAEVRIEDPAGGERSVAARFLIDASGRDGFLAKRLQLRVIDPELRMVGLHAWYEGVEPLPPERAGDIRLVAIEGEGWAWLIPLGDGVTSVGVVVSKERHSALPTGDPERCLDLLLRSAPALPPLLAGARRASPVRVEGDYSYATRAYHGERWLLAGDAGSFLDPIFSTGVLLALESGVQAAEAVDGALAAGEAPAATRRLFAAYDREQGRKYRFFRRFVVGYYRPEFRDLLVNPDAPFGIAEALITAFAGNTRPPLLSRLLTAAFFAFVRLQRHLAISPRLHGPAAERLRASAGAGAEEAAGAGTAPAS